MSIINRSFLFSEYHTQGTCQVEISLKQPILAKKGSKIAILPYIYIDKCAISGILKV